MKLRRRTFLRSVGAAAAVQIVPRHVLGGPGYVSPNAKIRLAAVGCGGQAWSDLKNMLDEEIVALCDVDERRAAEAFKRLPNVPRYKDFRVMLDECADKIDAVLVGTPDHTHAVATLAALRRNKHVFCEKPLAHSVAELRAIRAEAARRAHLVTQTGNQGHSSESIRVFCEMIWDGAIGKVTEVHCACDAFPNVYCQIDKLPSVRSERPPVPPELAWDLWLGPAQERPYHPAYVPWNWRGWMAFGTGAIGDWVCHVVDPVFWALDLDMPETIQAEVVDYDPREHADCYPPGSKITFTFPAKGERGPVTLIWHDGKIRPPRPPELEPDRKVPGVGAIVIGTTGKIMYGSHGAGGCRIIPEARMKEYRPPEKKLPRVKDGHYRDWLNAIREGRPASSPFDYGSRLSEIGLLGAIAVRFPGVTLRYDPVRVKFTNCEEANAFLNPPYRAGWSL